MKSADGRLTRDRRRLRILALAAAGIAALVTLRGSRRPDLGNQSWATFAAASGTALSAAAFAFISASPRRIRRFRVAIFSIQRRNGPALGRFATFALLAAAAGIFGFIHLRFLRQNPGFVDDQADYLIIAEDVRKSGGPLAMLPMLYRGEYREDNRNPLYVALLSPLPTMERGVGLSRAFAVLTIGWICFTVWRRAGRLACVLCALLLAANRSLHASASLVACETLLCLFVALTWSCLTLTSSSVLIRSLSSALAGGFLGLAFLTKSSAFLLTIVAVVAAFRFTFSLRERLRNSALIALGFCIVASPLLVRNQRVYGQPLHNFNNKLLFADDFESGRDEPNRGIVGNWRRFRERHSWSEILRDRLVGGLLMEAFVLIRSLGPWPFDSGRALLGMPLAALALLELARRIRSNDAAPVDRMRLFAGWTVIDWIFFAWYLPIAASDRFTLPLAPIALGEGAIGLARLLGVTCRPRTTQSRK